jgi:hypothetical protein
MTEPAATRQHLLVSPRLDSQEDSLISSYVYCIFVEKACTDVLIQVAQL